MTTVATSVPLAAGQDIEVRCHFNCSWVRGFTVAETVLDAEGGEALYRIRRAGDGAVLPALFPAGYVRDGRTSLFT